MLSLQIYKFLAWLFLLLPLPVLMSAEAVPTILVTQGPYKYFVEKIAGDTVSVSTVVPNGVSAHSFEPSAKQILLRCQADIWFQMGETFEKKASQALKYQNPSMDLVDLRQGVDLIYGDCQHTCCHCAGEGSADLHVWVSPRMVKVQAYTIAQALIKRYPSNTELYQQNLIVLQNNLDQLDHEIEQFLSSMQNRLIVVSHPSYSYLCRDYNLTQLSLEFEGKDPTPQQLTKLLNQIRNVQVKTIFVQPQYGRKAADLIAKHCGAQVISLDPYAEEYFSSMRAIAKALGEQ